MKDTVTVGKEFVREALQNRYNEVFNLWGNAAAEALWDDFLEMLLDCGIGENTTPMSIVDNYLVNGDMGEIDNYREEGETDEEVLGRVDPLLRTKADDGMIYIAINCG